MKSLPETKELLINLLVEMDYQYISDIRSEQDLIENLKKQLERLNSRRFMDKEWEKFLSECLSSPDKLGIENRNEILHSNDGFLENIKLLDKQNPDNNFLQVISLRPQEITILLNGFPMVQINLEREDFGLEKCFSDSVRLVGDTYSSKYKLLEFVQIFVFSNFLFAKYFSNTTQKNLDFMKVQFWNNSENIRIAELTDFFKLFLNPSRIKKIISKYCLLSKNKDLMILYPHQIEAIERIEEKVRNSITNNSSSRGYVWHACGTGKTLTSQKTLNILLEIPEVKKALYVMDEDDLDNESREIFGNHDPKEVVYIYNSRNLVEKLTEKRKEKRIIITTTKTLMEGINQIEDEIIERTVIVYDECKKSQMREINEILSKRFSNVDAFLFTGSHSFDEKEEDIFGKELHRYGICFAMRDQKILEYKPEYKIDERHPGNKKGIVEFILWNFPEQTMYGLFNGILVADSVTSAIEYHRLFEKLKEIEQNKLNVEIIYPVGSNWEENDYLRVQMKKYFGRDKKITFEEYAKEILKLVKSTQIDILIVHDMFLGELNSPMLNTIWIDRVLEGRELIRAISRTNKRFRSIKESGNIVCFRDLRTNFSNAIQGFCRHKNKNYFS